MHPPPTADPAGMANPPAGAGGGWVGVGGSRGSFPRFTIKRLACLERNQDDLTALIQILFGETPCLPDLRACLLTRLLACLLTALLLFHPPSPQGRRPRTKIVLSLIRSESVLYPAYSPPDPIM